MKMLFYALAGIQGLNQDTGEQQQQYDLSTLAFSPEITTVSSGNYMHFGAYCRNPISGLERIIYTSQSNHLDRTGTVGMRKSEDNFLTESTIIVKQTPSRTGCINTSAGYTQTGRLIVQTRETLDGDNENDVPVWKYSDDDGVTWHDMSMPSELQTGEISTRERMKYMGGTIYWSFHKFFDSSKDSIMYFIKSIDNGSTWSVNRAILANDTNWSPHYAGEPTSLMLDSSHVLMVLRAEDNANKLQYLSNDGGITFNLIGSNNIQQLQPGDPSSLELVDVNGEPYIMQFRTLRSSTAVLELYFMKVSDAINGSLTWTNKKILYTGGTDHSGYQTMIVDDLNNFKGVFFKEIDFSSQADIIIFKVNQ